MGGSIMSVSPQNFSGAGNGGIIGPTNTTTQGGPIAAATTTFTSPGTFTQTFGAPALLDVLVIAGGGGGGQRKGGGGAGELAYLRGEKGVGTSSADYRPGAFAGKRYRAAGGAAYVVGEGQGNQDATASCAFSAA